ncbi:MAG: baseplate J/gp47 family protein [Leptolyngbyaceae cyanobacterium]
MSFRRRPFPEVLDNLLTSITGGVSAETHPFPPGAPPYTHFLQTSAVAEIQSVYGQRDGQSVLFRQGQDYRLDSGNQLIWQDAAQLPDAGTLITINYYPQDALPNLTDIYTGSVVRTLSESMALEMARMYAQMEQVYESGFVNTATGSALDNVVALLGIDRVTGGYAAGILEFSRAPNSRGAINIPTGTRVITADGNVEYETIETVQMAAEQTTIRVKARDLEPNDPLPADTLTTLVIPLAGIGSVRNPAPTAITTRSETDVELRSRAKNFLYGSQRATLGALKQVAASQGVTVEIDEIDDGFGCRYVQVTPQTESLSAEQLQRLDKALQDVRPVGVEVKLAEVQPPVKLDISLRLTTASDLLEQDLRAVQRTLQREIEDYLIQLPTSKPGSVNQLIGRALAIDGIDDISLVDIARADGGDPVLVNGELATQNLSVRLGALDIADPNLPTKLTVVVTAADGAAPIDQSAVEVSISALLTQMNGLSTDPSATPDTLQLTYSQLRAVVPLPGEGYQVTFIFTQATQLSHILASSEDPAYVVSAFEQLSLSAVEQSSEEATNG